MTDAILAPVEIKIPADSTFVIAQQDGSKKTIKGRFVEDYILGNIIALPQFFGQNLARRRVGHKIGAAFRGKGAGDVVALPRALAWECWRAASECDYTHPISAQLPDAWLWAIPEVEEPPSSPPPAPTEPAPAPDANPPLAPSEEDAAALAAIASLAPKVTT